MNATLSDSARPYTTPGADQYPQTTHPEAAIGPIHIRKASLSDIWAALAEGVQDWRALRTDVLVLVVLYPLAAICLAGVIIDNRLLPFVFPICTGMALIGPAGTLWFAALSRQRERDGVATADSAGAIFDSARLHTIQSLAVMLVGLFILWVAAAGYIYTTLLAGTAASMGFLTAVFTTTAGFEMIIIGVLTGAVFALLALVIGLVGFQLAIDREMSVSAVLSTSFRVALANPVVALGWGVTIVAGMIIGAIPGLLGLAVTIPILGHTSWHLYRRLITE